MWRFVERWKLRGVNVIEDSRGIYARLHLYGYLPLWPIRQCNCTAGCLLEICFPTEEDTVWGALAAKSRSFSERSSLVFNEISDRIIWLYRWQHQQFIIGRSANTSWSENWNLVSFHEQFIIGWICAQTVPKRMTQWPLRRSPASDNPYLKTIIISICHEY